jgi:tetratricopeptide (TPR) repeat protein/SAM-dependent methyltransferase
VTFDIKAAMAEAIALYQRRDLAPVSEICRSILAREPDHVEATHLLGVLAYVSGRHIEAVELIGKAIRSNDRDPQFHNNLGLAHAALGDTRQAASCYERAIALAPNFALARMNLGNLLRETGHLDEAAARYRESLAIDPDHAHAHSCLGLVLAQQGHLDQALAHYRQALAINPNDAELQNHIGWAFSQQNKLAEAAAHFRRAVELDSKHVLAHANLARVLSRMGDTVGAMQAARRALTLQETPETQALFAQCAADLRFIPDAGTEFCGLLARAITEPWHRSTILSGVSIGCLKADPAIRKCIEQVSKAWPQRLSRGLLFGSSRLEEVSRNTLLLAVLASVPVLDMELERFLATTRFILLQAAAGGDAAGPVKAPVLRFYSALAQQCFLNGYIYVWTDEERQQAFTLREKLVAALKSGARIPTLWPVAVAAYFPLCALDNADVLLGHRWRDGVDAVLEQQVREPRQESELRKEIPRVTPISDDVSAKVREFYEENPYPCWVKTVATPGSGFPGERLGGRPSILIAGCGTGQHSMETAKTYPNADILAVDLSLTSLGYALRKTREAKVANVRYAQADILELASLDRKFDLIESVGVLHHLSNPLQGWRVLLSLLRPGGSMRIGLYSELARRAVTAARVFFAERGYGPSAEDIRRFRHDLWSAGESDALLRSLMSWVDFYSLGPCRDMLFHIQEHRFTLPAIKAFLADNDLAFNGFVLAAPIITKYRSLFPQDQAATNLDLWHAFETKNPDTFGGMYQFWLQSRSA